MAKLMDEWISRDSFVLYGIWINLIWGHFYLFIYLYHYSVVNFLGQLEGEP